MRPNPGIEEYLLDTVYGGKRDLRSRLMRASLLALSLLYRCAIFLYLLPFKLGLRKKKRLSCPVISVGNLTVGGTGKTPAVRYICDGLIRIGRNPAVLSYGYGGSLHGRFAPVSDGKKVLMSASEAGDEPVMLANQLTGVAVLGGKDRYATGTAAIRDYGTDVIVLDDGLQVWKLHRDLDIVLVDADSPFDNGRSLPAGRLRQPAAALRSVGCVLVTGRLFERREQDYAGAMANIRKVAPDAQVFFSGYQISSLTRLNDGSAVPERDVRGRSVFALSSIARPEAFERTIEQAGAVIVGRRHFCDHCLYRPSDIERVCREAKESGAECIVTTEKDQVKIRPELASMPILILGIRMFLDNEAEFWEIIAKSLRAVNGQNSV